MIRTEKTGQLAKLLGKTEISALKVCHREQDGQQRVMHSATVLSEGKLFDPTVFVFYYY